MEDLTWSSLERPQITDQTFMSNATRFILQTPPHGFNDYNQLATYLKTRNHAYHILTRVFDFFRELTDCKYRHMFSIRWFHPKEYTLDPALPHYRQMISQILSPRTPTSTPVTWDKLSSISTHMPDIVTVIEELHSPQTSILLQSFITLYYHANSIDDGPAWLRLAQYAKHVQQREGWYHNRAGAYLPQPDYLTDEHFWQRLVENRIASIADRFIKCPTLFNIANPVGGYQADILITLITRDVFHWVDRHTTPNPLSWTNLVRCLFPHMHWDASKDTKSSLDRIAHGRPQSSVLLGQQGLDPHDMYKNTRTLLYAHTEAFEIFSKSLQHHLRELPVNSQCNFALLEPANLAVGYNLLSNYIQDSHPEGHAKPTWMERRLERVNTWDTAPWDGPLTPCAHAEVHTCPLTRFVDKISASTMSDAAYPSDTLADWDSCIDDDDDHFWTSRPDSTEVRTSLRKRPYLDADDQQYTQQNTPCKFNDRHRHLENFNREFKCLGAPDSTTSLTCDDSDPFLTYTCQYLTQPDETSQSRLTRITNNLDDTHALRPTTDKITSRLITRIAPCGECRQNLWKSLHDSFLLVHGPLHTARPPTRCLGLAWYNMMIYACTCLNDNESTHHESRHQIISKMPRNNGGRSSVTPRNSYASAYIRSTDLAHFSAFLTYQVAGNHFWVLVMLTRARNVAYRLIRDRMPGTNPNLLLCERSPLTCHMLLKSVYSDLV